MLVYLFLKKWKHLSLHLFPAIWPKGQIYGKNLFRRADYYITSNIIAVGIRPVTHWLGSREVG